KTAPETRTLQQMATSTVFRHKIWYLEFTFKPMRMIWVDVPQPSGKMQRKLIWYLLYHVTNRGQHLEPTKKKDGTYDLAKKDYPVKFVPTFALESKEFGKAYLDRLIPTAVEAIRRKEDPARKLLNSVEISAQSIPVTTEAVDNSVW